MLSFGMLPVDNAEWKIPSWISLWCAWGNQDLEQNLTENLSGGESGLFQLKKKGKEI